MQEHEQRVVDEQAELSGRLLKLDQFILNDKFDDLAEIDRVMLLSQQDAMHSYNNCLNRRIGHF